MSKRGYYWYVGFINRLQHIEQGISHFGGLSAVFNKFKALGKGKKAHNRVSAKENIRSQSRQIEKYCSFEWLKIVRDLTLLLHLNLSVAVII
ncbi:hypothetical protein [Shewanella oncorhynchi]|uniref:hypothetical protein n=1 Tax=Shewanella oncorhynchi TaxID=2726434 RepID=UPI003D793F14